MSPSGLTAIFLYILREKASAATQAADKAGLESSTQDGMNEPEDVHEQRVATRSKKFANPGIYKYGSHNSSSLAAATRELKDSTKRKPKTGMCERSQNSTAYNNMAPRMLSEFDNDWNLDSGLSIKIDRIGLQAKKPVQINFVRYPPYPTKRATNCQGQERRE